MYAHAAFFLLITMACWGAFRGVSGAKSVGGHILFAVSAIVLVIYSWLQLGVFAEVWAGYSRPITLQAELALATIVGYAKLSGVLRG